MGDPLYAQLGSASLGYIDLRLAEWIDPNERFQDSYRPVDPRLQFLPNDPISLASRFNQAYWKMDDWSGGAGFPTWRGQPGNTYEAPYRDANDQSGMRVDRNGKLTLPWDDQITNNSSNATFTDGALLGYALGRLYVALDDDVYFWDEANSRWSTAFAVRSASANRIRSIVHPAGSGSAFSLHAGDVYKWDGSSTALHYASFVTATSLYGANLIAFDSRLFGLTNNDDLYEIDVDTATTRTLVYDASYNSGAWSGHNESIYALNRACATDVGVAWVTRLNSGQTFIRHYNSFTDTTEVVGRLPVDWAFPYSIAFVLGNIIVGWRDVVDIDTDTGPAFLSFFDGDGRSLGTVGPLPYTGGEEAGSGPVTIAGAIGSDLMVVSSDRVIAYSLDTGGMHVFGVVNDEPTTKALSAKVFKGRLFVTYDTSGVGTGYRTALFDPAVRTRGGVWFGRYDFAFFDIPKTMIEVTLEIDVDRTTSGTISGVFQVDDGVSGTLSPVAVDNTTGSVTWLISDVDNTFVGRRLRLGIRSATPTTSADEIAILSITARAVAAAHEREFTLVIDVSSDPSGRQDGPAIVAALQTLLASQEVVFFLQPWEDRPDSGKATENIEVQIREISFPDMGKENKRPTAVVKLLARDLVTP